MSKHKSTDIKPTLYFQEPDEDDDPEDRSDTNKS